MMKKLYFNNSVKLIYTVFLFSDTFGKSYPSAVYSAA